MARLEAATRELREDQVFEDAHPRDGTGKFSAKDEEGARRERTQAVATGTVRLRAKSGETKWTSKGTYKDAQPRVFVNGKELLVAEHLGGNVNDAYFYGEGLVVRVRASGGRVAVRVLNARDAAVRLTVRGVGP